MHWIAIALLALFLGYINAFLSPKISAAVPASLQQNKIASTFINGAIILVAVAISVFLLHIIGMRPDKA